MRIFLSTFIDVPDNTDIQPCIERAVASVVPDDSYLSGLSKNAYQLIDNLQYNFSDNSDKE